MGKINRRKKKFIKKEVLPKQEHQRRSNTKIVSDQINQKFSSGVQHYQSGNLSEAEACFQRVLEWQPHNPDAWHLLGVIAARQKQYPIATERISRAIELKPTEANFYNNLGRAYLEQEQFQKAIECYQAMLKLQPKNAETYSILGNLYRRCGQLIEAIATYEQLWAIPAPWEQISLTIFWSIPSSFLQISSPTLPKSWFIYLIVIKSTTASA